MSFYAFGTGALQAIDRKLYENRMLKYENMLRDRELKDWKEKKGVEHEFLLKGREDERSFLEQEKSRKVAERRQFLTTMGFDDSKADYWSKTDLPLDKAIELDQNIIIGQDGKPVLRSIADREELKKQAGQTAAALGWAESDPAAMLYRSHILAGKDPSSFFKEYTFEKDARGKIIAMPLEIGVATINAARVKPSSLSSADHRLISEATATHLGDHLARLSGGKITMIDGLPDPVTGRPTKLLMGQTPESKEYVATLTQIATDIFYSGQTTGQPISPEAAVSVAFRQMGDYNTFVDRQAAKPRQQTPMSSPRAAGAEETSEFHQTVPTKSGPVKILKLSPEKLDVMLNSYASMPDDQFSQLPADKLAEVIRTAQYLGQKDGSFLEMAKYLDARYRQLKKKVTPN